jgi:spore coat protein H
MMPHTLTQRRRRHAFPVGLSRLAVPLACALVVAAPVLADDKAAARPELKAQAAPNQQQPDAVDEFFERGPIPRLRIELAPEELNKLRQNGRAYVSATVRETADDGGGPEVVYEKVALHLKGAAGSYRDIDDKPGLTLNFARPETGGQRAFHGLRKVHLNNSVQDPSYLSENLGNALFRDAGIPAARVTYARVWINGRDVGLFVLKEGFDDVLLKRFLPEPHGTVYEGGFLSDVDGQMPPRVNKSKANPARVKELVAAAREGDPAKRRERLAKVLDTDRFITFLAVESLTAHWDGYCAQRNNYRVYHDLASDRFVFLPHGTDQLFQHTGDPVMYANAMAARALIDTPDERARCLERVIELRQKLFAPDALLKRIDAVESRLRPVAERISSDTARRHREQAEDFRRRVVERVKDVDRQLASMPRPLKFGADGVADLSAANWHPQTAGGKATLGRADAAGRSGLLHVRVDPGGGEATASFRTTVPLARGRYSFEGPCRTVGVDAPDGTNTGAGLRISGGQRAGGLKGDRDWQRSEFAFEVNEDTRDVVLVCELKAGKGEAWFDPHGLKLRRR